MPDKIEYTKPSKSSDELIALLEKRGLVINNKEAAKRFLGVVNYYRLSGYWYNYQCKALDSYDYPTGLSDEQKEDYENTFFEKVTFENIVDIYRFDTKLRSLCLDALEKIEIACGGALCEHMCTKYGGYWFTNAEHVKNIFVEKNKTDDFGNFIFNEKGKKVKEKVRIWGMDFLQERFDKLIEENKKNAMYCSFQAKIQQ